MVKTVIVGAGAAGLTAGIRLRQAGAECLILEKHVRPGGELTSWRRDAFLIDNSMHWLNGTLPGTRLNALWRTVGMLDDATVIRQSEVFVRSEWQGQTLDFGRDTAALRRRMLALSPGDREEIDALIDATEAMASTFRARSGNPLKRAADAVKSAAVTAKVYARYGRISLHELARRFSHPLIRMSLTGFIGGTFSALAWVYTYGSFVAGDADVPAGGSAAAAERMARRFVELGGELRLGAAVKKILTAGRKAVGVELADGEIIEADAVICAVDPAITFGTLLPRSYAPKAYLRALNDPALTHEYSALQTAFAARADEAPAHATTVADASADAPMPGGTPDGERGGRLSSPSPRRILLKRYTHEEGFAPEEACLLQTMQFIPARIAALWSALKQKDPAAYRAEKHRYLAGVQRALAARFGFSHLRPLDMWTPATYERYTGAHDGSFLGFAMTPRAVLWRSPLTVKGLSNVFCASQWRSAPGGLPVAAGAGERAAHMTIRALRAGLILPDLLKALTPVPRPSPSKGPV